MRPLNRPRKGDWCMYEVGGDIYIGRSMDTPPETEPFIHLYGVLVGRDPSAPCDRRHSPGRRDRCVLEDFSVITIDPGTARESITHAEALEWLEGCV